MTTNIHQTQAPVALVTGGSAGLGLVLVRALAGRGWHVVTDSRHPEQLAGALADTTAEPIGGDIRLERHRRELRRAVDRAGRLDLLVHNASELGPMLPVTEAPTHALAEVFATNLEAPMELTRTLLHRLRASDGALVSISSDAAVEHYPGWGLYGASKAALDHLTLTIGAESGVRAYAVDPGDMRTAMHQRAFPGEDISDRPLPDSVVPHLLALLEQRPESGRYRAAEVPVGTSSAVAGQV